jgi:hypothetical protein
MGREVSQETQKLLLFNTLKFFAFFFNLIKKSKYNEIQILKFYYYMTKKN